MERKLNRFCWNIENCFFRGGSSVSLRESFYCMAILLASQGRKPRSAESHNCTISFFALPPCMMDRFLQHMELSVSLAMLSSRINCHLIYNCATGTNSYYRSLLDAFPPHCSESVRKARVKRTACIKWTGLYDSHYHKVYHRAILATLRHSAERPREPTSTMPLPLRISRKLISPADVNEITARN